jgi:hypothetical protein
MKHILLVILIFMAAKGNAQMEFGKSSNRFPFRYWVKTKSVAPKPATKPDIISPDL